MATRKEVNKYYPPDWDPSKGSLNTYHGEGWRNGSATVNGRAGAARGITIIRFEMPWSIWCTGCNSHIGRGVRYNAEKNRVGKYYTTTLWSFSMKCHMCNSKMVIETDPKNDDYKIIEGARRRVETFTAESAETHELMSDEEKRKLVADPMFRLEHGEADKVKAKKQKHSLLRLLDMKSGSDYDQNCLLRKGFRAKKKELKAQELIDKNLMTKSSLNGSEVKLLPEIEEDKTLAKQMTLGRAQVDKLDTMKKSLRTLRHSSIFGHKSAGKVKLPVRGSSASHLKLLKKGIDPSKFRVFGTGSNPNSSLRKNIVIIKK
eukprot:m.100611 g.100611  ORF g.100611 m.100611 type:complete len:317 (+) comp13714_c0_seq9:152-1102(+)